MLGLSISAFTMFHVAISIVGIVSGAVVLAAMTANRSPRGWRGVFLITTLATSVTGFMFPLTSFGPPEAIGVISLLVLALAFWALYGGRLAGPWCQVYVVSAIFALYLNVFVGIVQAFQKVRLLQSVAPTQSAPAFLIAQSAVLLVFVVLGVVAIKHSRTGSLSFS